jgi:hypothetical protein
MSLEPKIVDHPGAGKIQEMTLDQYLSVLSPDHLARKQLDEIRSQALKAVELSTQLMAANEKVIALQGQLIAPSVVAPNIYTGDPPKTFIIDPLAPLPSDLPVVTKPQIPKAACPLCGKLISVSPGPWASHQRNQHADNPAPNPNAK